LQSATASKVGMRRIVETYATKTRRVASWF